MQGQALRLSNENNIIIRIHRLSMIKYKEKEIIMIKFIV